MSNGDGFNCNQKNRPRFYAQNQKSIRCHTAPSNHSACLIQDVIFEIIISVRPDVIFAEILNLIINRIDHYLTRCINKSPFASCLHFGLYGCQAISEILCTCESMLYHNFPFLIDVAVQIVFSEGCQTVGKRAEGILNV